MATSVALVTFNSLLACTIMGQNPLRGSNVLRKCPEGQKCLGRLVCSLVLLAGDLSPYTPSIPGLSPQLSSLLMFSY